MMDSLVRAAQAPALPSLVTISFAYPPLLGSPFHTIPSCDQLGHLTLPMDMVPCGSVRS